MRDGVTCALIRADLGSGLEAVHRRRSRRRRSRRGERRLADWLAGMEMIR